MQVERSLVVKSNAGRWTWALVLRRLVAPHGWWQEPVLPNRSTRSVVRWMLWLASRRFWSWREGCCAGSGHELKNRLLAILRNQR
jgi:hypothetical protein